ncbi:MAG: filamentous hemagglutinin N-terminal domain-containing protein [Verrucomicrobiae bacterium]|nr:filamentous hemagglutinin N-terminal domain-containing protein [Verrucomicrobiae bacterium]
MKAMRSGGLVSVYLLASLALTSHAQTPPLPVPGTPGDPTIQTAPDGKSMTVTPGTVRSIYNWDSFSIGADYSVLFKVLQQDAAVLNRVSGAQVSLINGALKSVLAADGATVAGHIYLINRNGIVVGPGGAINAGAFYGSTLNVADADFQAGSSTLIFGQAPTPENDKGIKVQGSIMADEVVLFSHRVENSGNITAKNGARLATGSRIELRAADSERISVVTGVDETSAKTGVDNQGQINAAIAELKAAGGNVLGLAINNGGAIRATKLVNEGGEIYLRATDGKVVNSGGLNAAGSGADGQGGKVVVSAKEVELSGSSVVVDVSGQAKAGTATFDASSGILVSPLVNPTFKGGELTLKAPTINLKNSISLDGKLTLDGAVNLGADTTLRGASVALSSTVDGGYALTVDGAATLGGAVGGVTKLTSLTLEKGATLNGGAVSTTGDQTYKGAVSLGADTTLRGANLAFNSTVAGNNYNLTLGFSGGQVINGNVLNGGTYSNLRNLTTENQGVARVQGQVSVAGSLTLNNPVTLEGDTTLSGVNLALNSTVAGNNNDLTLAGSGTTTLGGNVSGVKVLTSDAAGTLRVNGTVGANRVVANDGTIQLHGGLVTTAAGNGQDGSQTYAGAVSLGADTTLRGASVALNSTVDGGYALTVDGAATLGGAVGGVTKLTSLAVGKGATLNGGAVSTTGDQTYKGVVRLGKDTMLVANGGNLHLNKVDGEQHTLILKAYYKNVNGGMISQNEPMTVNNLVVFSDNYLVEYSIRLNLENNIINAAQNFAAGMFQGHYLILSGTKVYDYNIKAFTGGKVVENIAMFGAPRLVLPIKPPLLAIDSDPNVQPPPGITTRSSWVLAQEQLAAEQPRPEKSREKKTVKEPRRQTNKKP